jgi:steroid 5-alpha reductase family enzyme
MFYILLAVSAVITAAGFYKFVYFLSTGYAFSVAGLAVAMMIGFGPSLTLPVVILLGIIALYASRLGVFLVIREYKSGAYRKVLDEASVGYKKIPLFVKIVIWIFCSILYVMQMSPVFFRLQNGLQEAHTGWLYAGIGLVAAGLLIQTVADAQKDRAKKENPKAFCSRGLFKIVRFPSYFGEILVWTGVFVSSLPCLSGWFQIAFALAGYIGIVYVMFGSTRRLELRQNKSYGSDPVYQEYVRNTPVLIPLIPLHSVAEWKWLFV